MTVGVMARQALSSIPRSWLIPSLVGVVALISRALWLDRDLPSFGLTEIQPIDELYYTISAFDLYHHGSLNYQVVSWVPADGSPVAMLETVMTAVTLLLFGNNYYGLRMASVAAGVLIAVLMYAVLRREFKSTAVAVAASVYLLADFPLLLAERVAEPTVFRVLAVVAALLLASRLPSGRAAAVAFGAVATAGFVYVYAYNAFIVPAALGALFLHGLAGGWRAAAGRTVWGAAGAAAAFASYLLVIYLFYGHGPADAYAAYFKSANHASSFSTDWREAYYQLTLAASTNVFRFNFGLLIAMLATLPLFVVRAVRTRSLFDIFVLLLLAALFAQTAAINDYPHRKLLVVLPIAVVIVIGGTLELRHSRQLLGPSTRRFLLLGAFTVLGAQAAFEQVRTMDQSIGQLALLAPLYALLLVLLLSNLGGVRPAQAVAAIVVGAYGVFAAQLVANVWIVSGTVVGPKPLAVELLATMGVLAALLAVLFGRRVVGWSGALLAAALLAPTFAPDMGLIYTNKSYTYRDAMVSMAPYLNGRLVAGGWSFGFRLYNTSVPVLNWYAYGYRPGGADEYAAYRWVLYESGMAGAGVDTTEANSPTRWADAGMIRAATYVIAPDHTTINIYVRKSGQ